MSKKPFIINHPVVQLGTSRGAYSISGSSLAEAVTNNVQYS